MQGSSGFLAWDFAEGGSRNTEPAVACKHKSQTGSF